MTARLLIGDVFERMAELPDGSVDLVLTSPPFLALRSYLPSDHPDKAKEIGSEPTPAAFIDTLLALTAEWRRLLAPHGSIAVELGDTYSGSGGGGGDYLPGGMREGQQVFAGSGLVGRGKKRHDESCDMGEDCSCLDHMRESNAAHWRQKNARKDEWPLAKSLCLIPELYRIGLVYGVNPLTGAPSPAGQWRARNVVRWVRPNPPVGALGDKFRPATSEMVVACVSGQRYFDLDAVRTAQTEPDRTFRKEKDAERSDGWGRAAEGMTQNPAGAPPLDWWEIPTAPYAGTVTTYRQEPCGPRDGGQRTTSPDCPVHADLPGQLPKALRDARAGSRENRSGRTDDDHAQVQLDGFAPTAPSSERPTGQSSSDATDPACAPSATSRSTADRRTAPAPATTSPGTPSAGTAEGTGDTSTSPESSGQHPDTPSSSTGEACPSGDTPGTPPRTAGKASERSSEACSCSWFRSVPVQTTSHYATWPPALCKRPIEAMVPQKVCLTCGEPSRRITESSYVGRDGGAVTTFHMRDGERRADGVNQWDEGSTGDRTVHKVSETLGWSDCNHDNYRRGVVLDPFSGSGTTLSVATGLGRDAIGIDLDSRNALLAVERCGMFLTVEEAS